MNDRKPTTHQGDLAKLPKALGPLIERPQWCVWRWTQKKGRWQKPPFQALDPQRHASTTDHDTWSDYGTALAAVEAGKADGISFVLTAADPLAAIDLDHCRHAGTHSIDIWAQNFLDVTRNTYAEVTPSGEGIRIWGLTGDGTDPVNRKFTLEINGKPIAAELFRRAPKALTITGYRLDTIRELTNIDKAFHWAIVWGERRKAAADGAAAAAQLNGYAFNDGGPGHDIERIEQIVREGPLGGNRSDTFHTVVGHYLGCNWSVDQIHEHLQQFPTGIADKYIGEGRLRREIKRSAAKHAKRTLPLIESWKAPEPKPVPPARKPSSPPPPDPANDDAEDDAEDADEFEPLPDPEDYLDDEPEQAPSRPDPVDDPELEDPPPRPNTPPPQPQPDPADDPELDEDHGLDDELGDEDDELDDPNLPPSYGHGDPDPRPIESWLIKYLIPDEGHGLISGQWGTGKSFLVFDLGAAVATGQPFLGHTIKRQCGVLLIAAEGAREVRKRLDAVVREKCGGAERIPFRWSDKKIPKLLHKDAAKTLIAMARRDDKKLQREFGVPLGLVIIDTITACAGYPQAGGENDSATGQAIMDVLKAVAQALNCFVFGVHHIGKNKDAGTRGTVVTEDASDLILALLGERTLSGDVANRRLAIRKNKSGPEGQEFPFVLRKVVAPEPDPDGDPITTMVVDWQPAGAPGGTGGDTKPGPDLWAAGRTQDQRTAVLRLKRVLMEILADRGVDLPIPPDGPTVRMIDQEIVREQFYSRTPAEGTPKQKRQLRSLQFKRALGWAEQQQLIGIEEINDVTYLRLSRPDREGEEGPC